MFSKSSSALIARSGQQLSRQQWRRSGKCIRCFHATFQRQAGEDAAGKQNGATSQLNVPQQRPSRQQRAAMISEEVKTIQREQPRQSPADAKPDTFPSKSSGKATKSQAESMSESAGDAGATSAQPATIVVENADQEKKGAAMDKETAESPTEMANPTPSSSEAATSGSVVKTADAEAPAAHEGQRTTSSRRASTQPTLPEQLLFDGKGTATIAGSGYRQKMADHLKALAEPGTAEADRREQTRRKLDKGKLLYLKSAEEIPTGKGYRRIPNQFHERLVDKLVKGDCEAAEVLRTKKSSIETTVAQQLMLNGTYHPRDARIFQEKFASLQKTTKPASRTQQGKEASI